MNSAASCYVKMNGAYQPINAIPASIKCALCKQFKREELEDHLPSHINPKLNKNKSKPRLGLDEKK